ncbi:zinc metalloproteinase nas-13 [Daphnia magna]|uniref:zinc metalloproteinase nas-13 n=1 Tax=Daphnia magna TaxID=35525 RepID=UPI001E1BDCC7|nr:zinc metalloproteinase nas-13 [Daphnia magna]XP_032782910.2 zinc metalloproteinase nas-13 [Daphnia magna]
MMRLATFVVICLLALTLGWASPIGNAMEEIDPELLKEINPEYTPDLFEGDIMGINPGDKPKNAVRNPDLLWPNGVVYYTIDSKFSAQENISLAEVFALFESLTCITFVERTNQLDYVSIDKTESGCYSSVGRVGGLQHLALSARGLRQLGIPIHEFLHALGFEHEHSRIDRDDYVTINYDNIKPGEASNFDPYSDLEFQDLGAPYDYGSVMHYGAHKFAVDKKQPTIIVPQNVKIGQRKGFSETDLFKVNALYKCAAQDQKK